MKRRLLNLLTVLSMLLCVAVVALWGRSRSTMDLMHLRTDDRFVHVATYRGGVWLGTWRRAEHDPASLTTGYRAWPAWKNDAVWRNYQGISHTQLLGFHYLSGPPGGIASHQVLIIPAAFPLALTAAAPAVWLVARVRRRRRRSGGLCAACGYDLRATPGRCPECGTIAPVPRIK